MSDNQPLSGPSDAELFKSAMEQPAPEPAKSEPPPPADKAPETGQARDPETGRFTKQDAPSEAPAAAIQQQTPPAPEPGKEPPPDDAPIPSWRAREMREARDAEAARARQYEALLLQQQQELQQMRAFLQQQQKPPEQPAIPDMIVDPQGYHQYVQNQFASKMREQEVNFSFRLAYDRHGELFETAYGQMMERAQRGDPSVAKQVMASPDPGEAMVRWFWQERNRQLVGNDPEAWADKRFEERLEKDQQFRAQVYEKLRGMASPTSPNGQPNVQLPPSLNSVAAAAPTQPFNPTAQDNETIFNDAFRKDPRRAR